MIKSIIIKVPDPRIFYDISNAVFYSAIAIEDGENRDHLHSVSAYFMNKALHEYLCITVDGPIYDVLCEARSLLEKVIDADGEGFGAGPEDFDNYEVNEILMGALEDFLESPKLKEFF